MEQSNGILPAEGFDPQHLQVLCRRGTGEVIAAYVSEWKGNKSFHIRKLYKDESELWRPTKEGVTVPIAKLEEFLNAISELRK